VKIVVDTNVFINSVLRPRGVEKRIIDICLKGEVDLALSKPILAELGQVLHRPKVQKIHRWNDEKISQFIRDLSDVAEFVPGTTLVAASPDPKDNMFFACALEARAHYIVSQDERHVLPIQSFEGILTIRPTELIALLPELKRAA
jgi:uncharacterized protein